MMHAYALLEDGATRTETDVSRLPELAKLRAKCLWIDLEAPDEATLAALQDTFGLDAEAIEDCVSGEQRPRVDDYGALLFLIAYGAIGESGPPGFHPRKIAFFLGKSIIVSVHDQPLATTAKLRKRAERTGAKLLGDGPGGVLYAIIDSLADNYLMVAGHYDACLDKLEEESLETDARHELLSDVADVRRVLGDMRRSINAHQELVQSLVNDYDMLPRETEDDFRHVLDHLRQAQEQVEVLREHVQAIQQNYFSMLAERTNDFMRTLTLFATFVLPLSLVTGFYGMNIPLWPDPSRPAATAFALGIMGAVTGGMYLYFKRRNLF